MNSSFAPIGKNQTSHPNEGNFWPSFADIMMVITIIFLMATSLLVMRNWQLVSELNESMAAEKISSQLIESAFLVNSTLEERLANTEQGNSTLGTRLQKKNKELQASKNSLQKQKIYVDGIEADNERLKTSLNTSLTALKLANIKVNTIKTLQQTLNTQVSKMKQQLLLSATNQKKLALQLKRVQSEILESKQSQQQSIDELTQQKKLLTLEIDAYKQQMVELKIYYKTLKKKYEKLIKPARSDKGKYIAEVYYNIKEFHGEVIRYRNPGDTKFIDLSLAEVEMRLAKLKLEKGDNLYVKVIIPTVSGLTYNDAWKFMRNLLTKYDYYYQEN